jgi:D-alanine-D-alanine ligase
MKIKIGVFFGGQSVEHEVSIISAIQAINFFDREKYDIIPIYISKENYMYVGKDIDKIEEYQDINKLISKSKRILLVKNESKVEIINYPFKKFGSNVYDYIDIAFPIVHGTNVEDGALQGFFKTLNLPFVGCSVLSSAIGMDKYVMKTVLKDNEIPVLDCICFDLKDYNSNLEEIVNRVENKFKYPVIIKPINLGSSVGIKIAKNKESLIEAIDYAFEFSTRILIEPAITQLREINCSVLGDYETAIASECEEPINTDEILSYKDKYLGGEKTGGSKGMTDLKRKLPADISVEMKKEIQDLAVKTFQALGCNGVSRIDFIIDSSINKVYVNEINTIPGCLSFYLWDATSLKYKDLLNKMIEITLKREREEKNVSYSFDTNILSGIKLGGLKGSKMN